MFVREGVFAKCTYLEVIRYYDLESTRFIEVKCRLNRLTGNECPAFCVKARAPISPLPVGAFALIGIILGILISLLLGNYFIYFIGAIMGELVDISLLACRQTEFERLVREAHSRGMKVVIIAKD